MCMVKNEALLGINFCGITLYESCGSTKNFYLQNNIYFFVYKVKFSQLFSFS